MVKPMRSGVSLNESWIVSRGSFGRRGCAVSGRAAHRANPSWDDQSVLKSRAMSLNMATPERIEHRSQFREPVRLKFDVSAETTCSRAPDHAPSRRSAPRAIRPRDLSAGHATPRERPDTVQGKPARCSQAPELALTSRRTTGRVHGMKPQTCARAPSTKASPPDRGDLRLAGEGQRRSLDARSMSRARSARPCHLAIEVQVCRP